MNAAHTTAILSTVSSSDPFVQFEVRSWLDSDAVRHVVRTYPRDAAHALALAQCLACANKRATSWDEDERLAAASVERETGRKLARFRKVAQRQYAFDREIGEAA